MKTYLRYEETPGTGVICSSRSNSLLYKHGRSSLAITPAYDAALVWDIMHGELRARFAQRKEMDGEVACLGLFMLGGPNASVGGTLAVGRVKGRVDLHSFNPAAFMNGAANIAKYDSKPRASLAGHSAAVTCAVFSEDGSRLATGSMDTFIIIWDPVAETGLFRLRGHKDEVTCLQFCSISLVNGSRADLISSSKDTTMKVWDLETQHCERTLADHPNGVWCFEQSNVESRSRLFTGSSDGLIRSFDLNSLESLMPGPLNRQTTQRAETMCVCEDVLALQSAGRVIEFYRIRSNEVALKKQKRRLRRMREKDKSVGEEDERSWTQDELELICVLRTPGRARSISLVPSSESKKDVLCMVTFTNNLVELYVLRAQESEAQDADEDGAPASKKAKVSIRSDLELVSRIELPGHRNDIRCVDIGEDDELAVTGSDGAIKLWNIQSGACLRTMESGFTLCLAFSPVSLHSIAGTQEGKLLVHSLNDGTLVASIDDAHGGEPIFSLDIRPDGRELVTCGGDRQCKFWELRVDNPRKVSLMHKRTLRLGEDGDAQGVRFTRGAKRADQLKVCVAMLDSTVKVFHEDSLEFHLSLYGHKLPVLSMDSSDDGALLATGSADKSIKIWGLDFGDCHRTVFAHEGSVTCVRFVPQTHYLVSCGRDGRMRYWDCDSSMERILSFERAHYGDAFGVAVSSDGEFFVSVGKDKRLRRYDRGHDIVFIEEERAKELDEAAEEEREAENEQQVTVGGSEGTALEESLAVGKRTMQAVDISDRLIECLTRTVESQQDNEEEDAFLHRVGVSVAQAARSAPSQDLLDALVYLPTVHVRPMLIAFAYALKARVEVEVCAKAALTLIKIHGPRLVAHQDRDAVELLRRHLREALWELRDLVGKSSAGLRWLKRDINAIQDNGFASFEEPK